MKATEVTNPGYYWRYDASRHYEAFWTTPPALPAGLRHEMSEPSSR